MLIAAKESVANRRRAADILSELWLGVRMTLEVSGAFLWL